MIEAIEEFDKKTWLELKPNNKPDFEIPETWVRVFYKTYPRFKQIKLGETKKEELENIILSRESKREFTQHQLSFNSLNHIIYYSAALKPGTENRMCPSGGARYPIELYALVYDAEDISSGAYHYNVKENSLEQLRDEKPEYEAFFGDNITKSSAVLLMTGVLARLEVKYFESAYKFALIETGHIAQNINLLSQKLGLGCCCIGGFDNKKLIDYLDLVQEEEIPLYAVALGLPIQEVKK